MLAGIKSAINELLDELKKSREEQKEVLAILRGIKINETIEKMKEKEKKAGSQNKFTASPVSLSMPLLFQAFIIFLFRVRVCNNACSCLNIRKSILYDKCPDDDIQVHTA